MNGMSISKAEPIPPRRFFPTWLRKTWSSTGLLASGSLREVKETSGERQPDFWRKEMACFKAESQGVWVARWGYG